MLKLQNYQIAIGAVVLIGRISGFFDGNFSMTNFQFPWFVSTSEAPRPEVSLPDINLFQNRIKDLITEPIHFRGQKNTLFKRA